MYATAFHVLAVAVVLNTLATLAYGRDGRKRNLQLLDQVAQLAQKVTALETQDQQLTDAVAKLSTDIAGFKSAIDTEIDGLKNSSVADDPAVAAAITNLTTLSTQVESFTAALTPTPAAPSTDEPTV